MPYTTPTVDEFKARHPLFDDVADPYVEAVIEDASSFVDDSWFADDYKPAIMYLTAHMLLCEGALGGAVDTAGLIVSDKLGDASTTYANAIDPTKSVSDYGSTAFGRRYLELLRVNQRGPVTV